MEEYKPSQSKVVPSTEGTLSQNTYLTEDFVSMDQYVVKNPGRLPMPMEFDCERHTNMFHGGTIFCDAGLKHIHIENQVSLGVGETVNSKLKFEDCLWEQA